VKSISHRGHKEHKGVYISRSRRVNENEIFNKELFKDGIKRIINEIIE